MKTKKKVAKTNNRIAATEMRKELRIVPLNQGEFTLILKGMSQYVCHAFDEKSKQAMLGGQLGAQPTKGKSKIPRCPFQEFVHSLNWVSGEKPEFKYDEERKEWSFDEKEFGKRMAAAKFGIPLTSFKNSAISACRSTGYAMTEMRQMIFVSSDDDADFAVIEAEGPPSLREDIVRLANNVAMVRFRGAFDPWKVRIRITHNRDLITEEQVVNLFQLAGFAVGVGEGRPEKSALGWGRYEVESTYE